MVRSNAGVQNIIKKYVVYGLVDPRTNEIRYVGKTRQLLKNRLKKHYEDASNPQNIRHKAQWFRVLKQNGLRPSVKILQKCADNEKACAAEIWWISHLKSTGVDLTNLTSGGDAGDGWHHTEEVKKKMSLLNTGRKRSQKSIEATAAAHRGRKRSEETRQKISVALRGKNLSQQTRQKMSETHLARNQKLRENGLSK